MRSPTVMLLVFIEVLLDKQHSFGIYNRTINIIYFKLSLCLLGKYFLFPPLLRDHRSRFMLCVRMVHEFRRTGRHGAVQNTLL